MEKKESVVGELQLIKKQSGKSCSEIAAQTGLTNVYVAQLFRRQAQLKPETAKSLRLAVPGLNDDHIEAMKRPPLRSYDPNLLQDPCLYRLHEAVMHFGESIKEIINEDFGDGIGNAAHKNRGNKESNFKIFQQCLPGSWEAAFTWCLELAFMKDTWYLAQQLYTLLMICELWTSMEMRIDDHPIVVDGL